MTQKPLMSSTNPLTLDKERTAVLIVDVLGNPYASPGYKVAVPATLNAARICAAARQAGVPLFFCNDAHVSGVDRQLEIWGEHALMGDESSQPSPQLGVTEDDVIVEKRTYSGFFNTDLEELLIAANAHTLVFAGFDTNICIRHTVADAYFLGYNCVISTDATWSTLVGDQESGLEYCRVCYATPQYSTDEIIAALSC